MKLSVAEKLQILETLWDDLRREEAEISSPPWHGDVLKEREQKIAGGEEKLIDWEIAKKMLRDELK